MKTKIIFGLISAVVLGLGPAAVASGRGGGGGFGGGGHFGGGFGGGHFGGRGFGGGGHFAGGFQSAPRAGVGRPAYFYSRGIGYAGSRQGRVGSSVPRSYSPARTTTTTNVRSGRGVADSRTRSGQSNRRATLNGRTDHIADRHSAGDWHPNWDRRHSHYYHNRFYVYDDGFWFGLDAGFFPWDYYPYYAYDYYPYDYYPGYYADVEPSYYNEGVYSDTPVQDSTVTTVQKDLTQLGYYNGPIDGIYGPLTRDAVAKYQIDKNLDVNGSLTAQTLQSLGLPKPAAS